MGSIANRLGVALWLLAGWHGILLPAATHVYFVPSGLDLTGSRFCKLGCAGSPCENDALSRRMEGFGDAGRLTLHRLLSANIRLA